MRFYSIFKYVFILIVFTGTAFPAAEAQRIEDNPIEMQGVTIEERLGSRIPLNLRFINESGEVIRLHDYFDRGKPVIITLVYYNCPMLCTLVLNTLTEAMQNIDLTPGEDFSVATISIDQRETPELASAKKTRYEQVYGRPLHDGWHFHTGNEEDIQELADALGFQYYFDEKQDQFVHPAAAFVLTEDGTISRYLYGIDFNPRDLRLALLEASEGKIGSTVDRLILYCFHYDPEAKGYVVFAGNLMRIGGAVTLVLLSLLIGTLWLKERFKKSAANAR
ncbi:SCO family protein [candidate division KSB1 bacterium]